MPPRNIFQVTVNLPASIRNNLNNNEVFNPYVFVRNRLYHFVFHRFALLYARIFSDIQRKMIEFIILLAALFCFITLVYVHVVFVQTPITCLDDYKDVWQRNGIIRVEVLSGKKDNYSLEDSYWKEKTLHTHYEGQSYYYYTEQVVTDDDKKNDPVVVIERNDTEGDDGFFVSKFHSYEVVEFKDNEAEIEVLNGSEFEKVLEDENFHPVLDETMLAENLGFAYIMEFSLEYGFLRLRPSKRRELNISVTFVVLDPEVDKCFGGSFNQFLLFHFLGYDNILLSSIKKMAEKKDQKGFVRNAVMDIEYIFINNYTNDKSYITAGFVMIIFTLTISTLLRHSHHQIFIVVGFWMNYVITSFGRPRIHMWPRHLIPSSGAPVLTVILALVGMEAVMSDFFHDRSIALHVIVIVWFADLYDAVCCQSSLSKRHWFRFFYLYHFLFYAYNYKFGGVYWPLTLITSWLFTLHSMIFFFHHYELPRFLLRAARISAAHQAARDARPPTPPNEEPPQAAAETEEQDQPNGSLNTEEPVQQTEEDNAGLQMNPDNVNSGDVNAASNVSVMSTSTTNQGTVGASLVRGVFDSASSADRDSRTSFNLSLRQFIKNSCEDPEKLKQQAGKDPEKSESLQPQAGSAEFQSHASHSHVHQVPEDSQDSATSFEQSRQGSESRLPDRPASPQDPSAVCSSDVPCISEQRLHFD